MHTSDPTGDRLAAALDKAKADRERFIRNWNNRGQILFDVPEQTNQAAIEVPMDNSSENFRREDEKHRQCVLSATKALNEHVAAQIARSTGAEQAVMF